MSPCPFPTTITITPRASPIIDTTRDVLSVRVIVVGNGIGDPGSNHGRGYVSLHANTLEICINPSLFLLSMVKK